MKFKKYQIDSIAYVILVVALVIWTIQIRTTCEELGCLAVIFPIFGIMIISGIEFIINLVLYFKKKKIDNLRRIAFAISGIISILSLILILVSFFQ